MEVSELVILENGKGELFENIRHQARLRGITIRDKSRAELNRIAPHENHQGVIAFYHQPEAEDVYRFLTRNPDNHKPLILLDGVEDPHNFGAIIRSAEVLGAGGVLFRKRRAAGITPAVIKASAGSALRLPLIITSNIDHAIRMLKEAGYWVYGLDGNAVVSLWDSNLAGKLGLVFGNEGLGLSQLTRKRCDGLIRIPQVGKIQSLNVSVSVAIVLAEWSRRGRQTSSEREQTSS